MSTTLLYDLSIQKLRASYDSGATTPEKVISYVYDLIEEQPLHPTWIKLVPGATAIDNARRLSSSSRSLPLFGIPFAVKDNIDVAGLPTTAGCPAYSYVPKTSAFVVQRLLDAGAILVGKTNMDQFATGLVGTRSPYGACSSVFDSTDISGGSSSGSAVAVASGLVSFALGTDTAGSGRVPAALNNIVGLKPTRGLLSNTGIVPACRSLDCVSIFALNCHDALSVLETAQQFDPADPFSRKSNLSIPPARSKVRFGIPRPSQLEFFGDAGPASVYAQLLDQLSAEHAVTEIDFEPFQEAAELLYGGPFVAERFAALGEFVKTHSSDVDGTVGSIIRNAERFTASELFEGEYHLQALRQQTEHVWHEIDFMLLPTTGTTYKIQQVLNEPIILNATLGYYTNFVNLMDLAAVAVPAGFSSESRPFGVSVIGPAFREQEILQVGSQIQCLKSTFAGRKVSGVPEGSLDLRERQGSVKLGVVGAHLSGQPLNKQLSSRGAKLLRTTTTARDYKFFALTGTVPAKPGLVREIGFDGPGIEIEIWLISELEFGSFVAAVPAPLSIGSCILADGEVVKGFLCEPYATTGMPEITRLGSWRAYLAAVG